MQEVQKRPEVTRTIRYAMIDKSPTEMKALSDCAIIYFLCYFHVLQAWERFLRSAASKVSNKDSRNSVLADVMHLAKSVDEPTFHVMEKGFANRRVLMSFFGLF
jgi:hypothetical protein